MRIGIYGGTFDPVHLGHLLLAEACREACELDLVCFMPAAQSPHKLAQVSAPATDRAEMLRLAIAGHPQFEVDTWELDQGGVSYSVDTLRHLQACRKDATWFFLMGADSFVDFPTWREPLEILRIANLVVVERPLAPPTDWSRLERIDGWRPELFSPPLRVEMPLIEISSSDIRERVQAGKSIRFRTPRSVEAYMRSQRIYRGD